MTSYTPNRAGMDEFLNSAMLLELVRSAGEIIMAKAISMSPVGTVPEGDTHPGLYMSSFKIRTQLHGGVKGDRAEAIVYNDATDAVWVEFGHYGREPYRVLTRAAREAKWA